MAGRNAGAQHRDFLGQKGYASRGGTAGRILQQKSAQLPAGVFQTTAVFPALFPLAPLSVPLETRGGDLVVSVAVAGTSSAALLIAFWQVTLDGVPIGGFSTSAVGLFRTFSAAGTFVVSGLAPGAHLVGVNMSKSAFDAPATTLTIAPSASAGSVQSAGITVQEVTP